MCYYEPNKPPCTCTFLQLVQPCSNVHLYPSPSPSRNPRPVIRVCANRFIARGVGLRICEKCIVPTPPLFISASTLPGTNTTTIVGTNAITAHANPDPGVGGGTSRKHSRGEEEDPERGGEGNGKRRVLSVQPMGGWVPSTSTSTSMSMSVPTENATAALMQPLAGLVSQATGTSTVGPTTGGGIDYRSSFGGQRVEGSVVGSKGPLMQSFCQESIPERHHQLGEIRLLPGVSGGNWNGTEGDIREDNKMDGTQADRAEFPHLVSRSWEGVKS